MNGNRCWHALLYLQGSPSGGRGSLRLDGRNYCKCAKDRRAWSRHCLWLYQSRESIHRVLLGAEQSGCKQRWLCNSVNSLENAVPLYVCSQDKGEGCLACFAESVRSGFQGILGDPNSHLLPCYLSSLRTVWNVFGIAKAQTTKNLCSVWHLVAFFWNFSISF